MSSVVYDDNVIHNDVSLDRVSNHRVDPVRMNPRECTTKFDLCRKPKMSVYRPVQLILSTPDQPGKREVGRSDPSMEPEGVFYRRVLRPKDELLTKDHHTLVKFPGFVLTFRRRLDRNIQYIVVKTVYNQRSSQD